MIEQPFKIPESWHWTKLSKFLAVSKETTNDFSNTNLKYVGLENMKTNCGIVSFGNVDNIKSNKNVFKTGQILYGKLRPYLNKHAIASFDGICSTDIIVFDNADVVMADYVNYYFDTEDFINYIVSKAKGNTLPRVTKTDVLEAECPLPPLDEQQRIVDIIEKLFTKLNLTEEKLNSIVGYNDIKNTTIGKIEFMRKSILARAFRGKL